LEHRSELERTVRALIEKQWKLASSADHVERFRTLWIAAMLDERLSQCPDRMLGRFMRFVQDRLDIIEPEFAICEHAKRRLLGSSATVRAKHWRVLRNEGVHLLNAEVALYRAGIPHLLLPFQRNRFPSNTFMVPGFAAARAFLLDSGFRTSSKSPTVLFDAQTGRAIRLIEGIQPKR
jgi:hypothetical protein